MATRLNFQHETFGQLVRFAIVGFALAGVYSAIYWYLTTGGTFDPARSRYILPPVAAVVFAFLVSVSIGFVLHSRWSFRGHGQREDHALKVKFVLVQLSGFFLNELFTWIITGPLHLPRLLPLIPAIFVTPLATFALNRRLVFR